MGTSDLQLDAMDPMDRLVARGISVRALVALAPYGADWLAQHQDDRFRMCYFDETGNVVNEDVTAVGLVLRAQQLGWTVFEDLESGAAPWIFSEASYHFRRGIHWYASATDDTNEMLPLGFPARELKRAAKVQEREIKAARKATEAEAKAREAKAKAAARSHKRSNREARAWLIEYGAQAQLDKAKSDGTPLSPAQAKRIARGLVDQVVRRLEASKRERASGNEGSEDEVR